MQVIINGEPQQVPDGTTLALLLARLEVNASHTAVEVNRRLVPREEHADRRLQEGDELEIVTLVGGG
jgi:thiamine biosynthesis protein ThiS